MILIADSGSTKTTWVLIDTGGKIAGECQTAGINPFYQSEEDIFNSINKEFSLKVSGLKSLFFYGAGCTDSIKKGVVLLPLKKLWNPDEVLIESDLLCAARSLCGFKPGIAAILGTGSNSCYYDGIEIVQQVSPLGFILGDEGSGAVIGKKLVADVLKHQLPEHVCKLFIETYKLSPAEILDHVYKQPFPNRYLAQFTKFIHQNINEETLYLLIKNAFKDFFIRNINQYNKPGCCVNFIGSVAWYFSDPLKEAAKETGNIIGEVSKDPIEGLINYHSTIR